MDRSHEQAVYINRHLVSYPGCEKMLELTSERRNANITSVGYHFVPIGLSKKREKFGEKKGK